MDTPFIPYKHREHVKITCGNTDYADWYVRIKLSLERVTGLPIEDPRFDYAWRVYYDRYYQPGRVVKEVLRREGFKQEMEEL